MTGEASEVEVKQLLKCDSDENPLVEKSMTTAEKQRLRIRDDDKSEK